MSLEIEGVEEKFNGDFRKVLASLWEMTESLRNTCAHITYSYLYVQSTYLFLYLIQKILTCFQTQFFFILRCDIDTFPKIFCPQIF